MHIPLGFNLISFVLQSFYFFPSLVRLAMSLKHAAVVLLLILLFLQTGGSYIIFFTELWEARREASEYINGVRNDRGKITTLTFQICQDKIVASDLVFEEDDEFSYQGKMYDVIGTQKDNNHIRFKCYTDTRETELDNDLCKKIETGRDKPSQHKEHSHIKILSQDFIANDYEVKYFFTDIVCHASLVNYSKQQSPVYVAVILPPPELPS